MKKLIKYSFIILVLLSTACSKDEDLKKSIFISDPNHPSLPAYSEWGYNTFGVYYDRLPFISNDIAVPAKFLVTENQTQMILEGNRGDYFYYGDLEEMKLTFVLKDFSPWNYTDLMELDNRVFDLNSDQVAVMLTDENGTDSLNILSGQLQIIRAQQLRVDEEMVEVILSGKFEIQCMINDNPVSFSEGRFDFGIGVDNFFRY